MTGYIIGLLIALGIAYFLLQGKKDKKVKETVKPKTREEEEKDKFEFAIKKLLLINVESRKNITQVKVLEILESTLDSIKNITEEINKDKNFSESSVLFNRIIDKYLPELMDGYISLSPKGKDDKEEETVLTLQRLKTEVSLIEESLLNSSKEDFEATGKLIEAMFQKFEGGEL